MVTGLLQVVNRLAASWLSRLFIHQLDASCFVNLQQVQASIRLQQVWFSQTWCNLIMSTDLLQFVDNLQQVCGVFKPCTQPETPQTRCKLWILPAYCKLSTSCSKSVEFNKLQQVCENKICCNLTFADLMQVLETTYIKLVDKYPSYQLASSLLTTCSRLVIIKPEQAMRTHPDIGFMTAS